MFAAMLLFACLQLVFFARGVAVSPWYNSGMYAEIMKPQPFYTSYRLHSRVPANLQLLSPQRDDKVFFTLDQYYQLGQNDSMYRKVKKVFRLAALPAPDSTRFLCRMDTALFRQWFGSYAASWIDTAGQLFEPSRLAWNGKILSLTNQNR